MTRKESASESGIRPGIRRLLGLDVPRKDRIAAELEDELQMHLELRAEQLRKSGMSDEVAMQQARVRYGAIDQATADIRDHAARREHVMQRRITIDSLVQDTRFAFRTLGRSKSWTAIAVLTLALGIGANTAVFSVVNDLLLDPLRYPDPSRLVFISRVNSKSHLEITPTMEQMISWRNAKSLSGLEGVGTDKQTLVTNGDPVSAHVASVLPTFAKFAGARVVRGRFLQNDDAATAATPVVVISEHVWQARFGGTADIIGKTIKLEGTQRTIIGVLDDGVRVPAYDKDAVDVWVPLPEKGFLGGPAIGRMAKGATIASVQQELSLLTKNMERAGAVDQMSAFDVSVRVPGSAGSTRSYVFMLAGAVCLLLLIACSNVAHLLLARGAARERELSIRAALGAGRGRIVRQLVTESLILSAGGCIAGLAIGALSLRAIVLLRPSNIEELANAHIDSRVLFATASLSVLTGIVFGLIAGFSGRGGRSFEVLRSSVASTADRARNRLRSLLVITENALSVVLLIGAVLLIRTVVNLYNIDPGFDANNVYAMSVVLPEARYGSEAARQTYADQLLSQGKLVPGVEDATIATNAPSRSGVMIGNWIAEGGLPASNSSNGPAFTAMNTVQPAFFDLIKLRMVTGTGFGANAVSNREIIISKSLAQRLWGDTNVVGRRMRMEGRQPIQGKDVVWNVVAAVTPDVALMSLTDKGATPGIYLPMKTDPEHRLTLIVRLKSDRIPAAEFRRMFLSIDPSISPPEIDSVSEMLLNSVAPQRFLMALLSLFAILAVTLSAIGLYGVVSYMVSQSTREIGVRVALGAARSDVVNLVMKKGVLLSGVGLVIGLIASMWGSRFLKATLYGVTTIDPLSYLIGSAILLALAACACIGPTMRAVRIDPMQAMRSE